MLLWILFLLVSSLFLIFSVTPWPLVAFIALIEATWLKENVLNYISVALFFKFKRSEKIIFNPKYFITFNWYFQCCTTPSKWKTKVASFCLSSLRNPIWSANWFLITLGDFVLDLSLNYSLISSTDSHISYYLLLFKLSSVSNFSWRSCLRVMQNRNIWK